MDAGSRVILHLLQHLVKAFMIISQMSIDHKQGHREHVWCLPDLLCLQSSVGHAVRYLMDWVYSSFPAIIRGNSTGTGLRRRIRPLASLCGHLSECFWALHGEYLSDLLANLSQPRRCHGCRVWVPVSPRCDYCLAVFQHQESFCYRPGLRGQ